MSQSRQLAAIMFTDIVGYTALMGKDSDKALELIRISKEIQKPLVEKHNGKWLKEMGDGAMAQFSTALDAVNCSIEIQEIARGKLDAKLRIGIHLGDVTVEEDDVYGDGVNVASRLESIADPGGIYISDSIQKAIQGQTDVRAKYLGEIKLKNVAYGVRTYALQGVGLPVPSFQDNRKPGRFWAGLKGRRVWGPVAWATVVAVLVIAASVALWQLWTQRAQEGSLRPSARFDLNLPAEAPMTSWGSVTVSPDGTRLVYVAQVSGDRLFLRDMKTGETQPIPGTGRGVKPFFSPDGESVGFFAGGRLKTVSLAGGEPADLADVSFPMGGAWALNDTIYFTPGEGEGLSKVSVTGGQVERVTEEQDLWPDILPGGEDILFTRGFGRGIGLLRDGEMRRLLTADVFYARYVPSGHLVYAERGKLLAVAFDPGALQVTSQPVTLVDDLRTSGFLGGAPFAFSQDGLLVYASGQDREIATATLVWADLQGNVDSLGLEPGIYGESFDLSPDGTRIALPIRERGMTSDIWLYDISRGTLTRFTYGLRDNPRARSLTPRWTPDGNHIVFASLVFSSPDEEDPPLQLFWKPADGSREAVQLTGEDAPRRLLPESFNSDGSILTAMSISEGTGFDLWHFQLDEMDPYAGKLPKAEILLQTRDSEAFVQFSPDGKWVAYSSTRSGQYELYVAPYPRVSPSVQISINGGFDPLWHPRGGQLFYIMDGFYAVDYRLTPEFEATTPRLLFRGPFVNGPGHDVNISPDGDQFLVLYSPQQSEPNNTLKVVTNFFDELRRRVPGGS